MEYGVILRSDTMYNQQRSPCTGERSTTIESIGKYPNGSNILG